MRDDGNVCPRISAGSDRAKRDKEIGKYPPRGDAISAVRLFHHPRGTEKARYLKQPSVLRLLIAMCTTKAVTTGHAGI